MNKHIRLPRRFVACVCTVVLLVCLVPALSSSTPAQASTIADLEAQKEALAQQAKELEAQKDAVSGDLNGQKQRKDYIEQQIELKLQEIELNRQLVAAVEEKLAAKDAEIAEVEAQIAEKEAEMAVRFAKLQERLRAISKGGNLSMLQMLFSTDDYVNYLLKAKLMQQIARNDQALIDGLEEEVAAINRQKEGLDRVKADLEKERAALLEIQAESDRAKEELDALSEEVKQVIYELQKDIDYYNAMLDQVRADEEALEAEIDKIIAAAGGSSGGQLTGKMYWPSNSCTIVTDTYGSRYIDGMYNFHKGVDIACYGSAHGKDIIAAADGRVIFTNGPYDWGGGYGHYLMIDHGYDQYGRNIVTLYAHCSRILVEEGDWVTGGVTQVAEIGNTGWSYGAHLHFEVRVDGAHEDPLANGWI